MTQLRQSWPVLLLLLLLSPLLAYTLSDAKEAAAHDGDVNAISIASLTLDQFHHQLQVEFWILHSPLLLSTWLTLSPASVLRHNAAFECTKDRFRSP